MNQYQRNIDPIKMEQSRERSLESVLHAIQPHHKKQSLLSKTRSILLSTFVLIIAVVLMLGTPNNPIDNTDVLSALEQEKVVEISYLTSSFFTSTFEVNQTSLIKLSAIDTTEFEEHNDTINLYFDTLRVYLEDEKFQETIVVNQSEEIPNLSQISFQVYGTTYILELEVSEGIIQGILTVNDTEYILSGTMEEEEDEFKLELQTQLGDDFIKMVYKSEESNETEYKYEIQKRINNVESNTEVKVSFENNESKVEIKDGDNEYSLKKQQEDGVWQYKLEYKINNQEGQAIITEEEDSEGNITYRYQVKEGDVDKVINNNRPTHKHNEEDDDDNPGNSGNNKPQSTEEHTKYQNYSL